MKLYNSMTRELEEFESLAEGKVGIYNCGPTVYKRQHLGNLRRYLFSDVLRRSFEFFGYEVREIMNFTDVGHLTQDEIDEGEDKVEKEAKRREITPDDIAREQIKLFNADLKALNIQPATKYVRATKHIDQMTLMIEKLVEKDHAYVTPSGVYFDVGSFPDYGKLSGNTLAKLNAGSRVAVHADKRNPSDFVLWVVDPEHLQKWDSPWGAGYPGWHIECSAMSIEYLGNGIDIHTGGEDNKFPHHENEIAQSESTTGKQFVRMWLHNAHLTFKGAKLAKREGEQITLDTLQEKGYSPLAFRLLVFGSHYRSPVDFTWEILDSVNENLKTLEEISRKIVEYGKAKKSVDDSDVIDQFTSALSDDLNTSEALAVFLGYVKVANKEMNDVAIATLLSMDTVVGLITPLMREIASEEVPADVKKLVDKREEARETGEFEKSDTIRGEIEVLGFTVEDTPSGPRVKKLGN